MAEYSSIEGEWGFSGLVFSREKLGHIVITGYNGRIEKQPLDLVTQRPLVSLTVILLRSDSKGLNRVEYVRINKSGGSGCRQLLLPLEMRCYLEEGCGIQRRLILRLQCFGYRLELTAVGR